jgi:hypothetical protein
MRLRIPYGCGPSNTATTPHQRNVGFISPRCRFHITGHSSTRIDAQITLGASGLIEQPSGLLRREIDPDLYLLRAVRWRSSEPDHELRSDYVEGVDILIDRAVEDCLGKSCIGDLPN